MTTSPSDRTPRPARSAHRRAGRRDRRRDSGGAARGRRDPLVPRAPPGPVGPHRGRHGAGRGGRARGRRRRAYEWLAAAPERGRLLVRGVRTTGTPPGRTDRGRETNFCAYIAVGVWHHFLATGDETFLDRMWPAVYAAVEFVLRLQQPGGQIGWKRESPRTGRPRRRRAADREFVGPPRAALRAGDRRGARRAAARLGAGGGRPGARDPPAPRAVPRQEPLLDGLVLPGARRRADAAPEATARIEERWDEFVVPGLGVRCVLPNPWVTGGESC